MKKRMDYGAMIFDLDRNPGGFHPCADLLYQQVPGAVRLGPLSEEQMMTIVGDGYKMQMRRSLAGL